MRQSDQQKRFPIHATQQGGIVWELDVGEKYIFIVAPDNSGFKAGDTMPAGWDIFPASDESHQELAKQFCLGLSVGDVLEARLLLDESRRLQSEALRGIIAPHDPYSTWGCRD